MKGLNTLALAGVVGAINWGLVAVAELDLVAEIFDEELRTTNAVTRILYGLVGIAGLYLLVTGSRRDLLPARSWCKPDPNRAPTAAGLGRGYPESLTVGVQGQPDVSLVEHRVPRCGAQQLQLVVEHLDA
jgi:uncharacterized protein